MKQEKQLSLIPSAEPNCRSNPFLATSLEELKEMNGPQQVVHTKIVNTNVSREVMKEFVLHCFHVNKNRKEVFPLMLKSLLNKYIGSELILDSKLNGNVLNLTEKINGNFEYDVELVEEVKEFRARNLVKFNVVYEQAIIQYLNDFNQSNSI